MTETNLFLIFLLWYPHSVEDIFYDHICRDALTDRFIGESDTVTEDIRCERLHILGEYIVTTLEKCEDTCCPHECETCTSRCAVGDTVCMTTGRYEDIGDIVIDFVIYPDLIYDIVLYLSEFLCRYFRERS